MSYEWGCTKKVLATEEDNYNILTSKYGEKRINKAIDAGILTESILGKKLEFFSENIT